MAFLLPLSLFLPCDRFAGLTPLQFLARQRWQQPEPTRNARPVRESKGWSPKKAIRKAQDVAGGERDNLARAESRAAAVLVVRSTAWKLACGDVWTSTSRPVWPAQTVKPETSYRFFLRNSSDRPRFFFGGVSFGILAPVQRPPAHTSAVHAMVLPLTGACECSRAVCTLCKGSRAVCALVDGSSQATLDPQRCRGWGIKLLPTASRCNAACH